MLATILIQFVTTTARHAMPVGAHQRAVSSLSQNGAIACRT